MLHHSIQLSKMVLHHFREVFYKLNKSEIPSTDILVGDSPVDNKHKFEYLSPENTSNWIKLLSLMMKKWSVVKSSEPSGY